MKRWKKIYQYGLEGCAYGPNHSSGMRDDASFQFFEDAPKIIKLLKQLKVPFSLKVSPRNSGFGWDGSKICAAEYTVNDVLHDLAHYQCSSPKGRKLPEFGLGIGFSTTQYEKANNAKNRSGPACQHEEELASVLGILWEGYLGYDFVKTFETHGWDGKIRNPSKTFVGRMGELYKMGLIDKNGVPTNRINMKMIED